MPTTKDKAPAFHVGAGAGARDGANGAGDRSLLPFPDVPVDASRVGIEEPAVSAQPASHHEPTRQDWRRVFSKADRSKQRRDAATASGSGLTTAPDTAPDTAHTAMPDANGPIPLVNGKASSAPPAPEASELELPDAHAVPSADSVQAAGKSAGHQIEPNGVDVLALK